MRKLRKSIALFGGTGYMGAHIALKLHQKGYKIILVEDEFFFDQRNYLGLEELCSGQLKLYKINWSDTSSVNRIFILEKNIELVVYAANQYYNHFASPSMLKGKKFHIDAMLSVFSIIEEIATIPTVLLSSYQIYGKTTKSVLKEDFKRLKGVHEDIELNSLAENLILLSKAEAVVARLSTPLGVHSSLKLGPSYGWSLSPFHKNVSNALYHGKTFLKGIKKTAINKTYVAHDIIHALDASEAIALIVDKVCSSSVDAIEKVYNVSGNHSFDANKLAKAMLFYTENRFPVAEKEIDPQENLSVRLSNDRLKADFGWFMVHPLIKAIKSHVDYFVCLQRDSNRAA